MNQKQRDWIKAIGIGVGTVAIFFLTIRILENFLGPIVLSTVLFGGIIMFFVIMLARDLVADWEGARQREHQRGGGTLDDNNPPRGGSGVPRKTIDIHLGRGGYQPPPTENSKEMYSPWG